MSIISRVKALAALAQSLLTGEPLRAINYGAIAVVYLVVKAMVLTGNMQDPPDFDGIAIAVTAAIAAVTEVARRFVFSLNTVERVIETTDWLGADAGKAEAGIGDTT